MSIINQTLRDLDARKADPESRHASVSPVPATSSRRRGLWIAGAALLPVAGLAMWFGFRPAEVAPRPQVELAKVAAAPLTAAPALRAPLEAPFVAPPAPIPISVQPKPAVAASSVMSLKPDVPVQQSPEPIQAAAHSERALAKLPTAIAAKSPIITKELYKPSAEEEAEERYRKAVTLVQKGRETQARPLLEEAIRLFPAHVAARQTLATLLSESGLNREAEAVLREGRAATPDNAWFALSLARMQVARGDVEGAATTLQSGIEGRGVNAEYRATLAALLVRLKHHPEAARQYEQALKLQPEQGTWWMGLGLALAAQGKTEEARSAYNRALVAGNLPEKLEEFVRAKLAE